jgi:spermidine synthase
LNTAGAAIGTLALAFVLVPRLGVGGAVLATAGVNFAVAAIAWALQRSLGAASNADPDGEERMGAPSSGRDGARDAYAVVLATGFATFALEVVWFRSLLAAFQSTSESFALMLVSVLVPLSIGAALAPALRRRGASPVAMIALAAMAVLLATPFVERIDLLAPRGLYRPDVAYAALLLQWLALSLVIAGPPMLLLGTALPLFLDRASSAGAAGRIYAVNTIGAVFGSLLASWALLPLLGTARSSWLVAVLLLALATARTRGRLRVGVPVVGALALFAAVSSSSSLGRDRIQTSHAFEDYAILAFEEGPDSTVSVVETSNGRRRLLIDGFTATSERDGAHTNYMAWMGRLPMLLHPAPARALVIAFGTGQTAAGVLAEGPERLDIVEISPAVLRMAPYFESNGGVLDDPRVHPTVMDGRAWVRRTDARYDVVTLEPMPPYFRGVNALYSVEFYARAAARMTDAGVIAQWLPFHLVTTEHALAVTRTFVEIFPDAALWVDPQGGTGILLGRRSRIDGRALTETWPGLSRRASGRNLPDSVVRRSVILADAALRGYAADGRVITDSNQLLGFGLGRGDLIGGSDGSSFDQNMKLIERHWLSTQGRGAGRGRP